ncbi:unnamed protein product, partial [Mesorhabditis spiculigera]
MRSSLDALDSVTIPLTRCAVDAELTGRPKRGIMMQLFRSLLRTSSGSYPYPRSHTTVMVLPSLRPIEPEQPETTDRLRPVRRPPLNRAIPTIPESKSNESIMTHNSERHDSIVAPPEDQCVIIENRMVETISRIPAPKVCFYFLHFRRNQG